jgi:acyl-CoA-dependent ceramide synthase
VQSAKSLNYVDAPITTPYFCFFSCVWIYLRHYINLRILYSIFTSFSTIGPFLLDWEGEQFKCWISQYISFGLLAALQAINIFWLFFILRIAYVAVFENVAKDTRSDDEDTGAEEDEPIREIPADKKKAAKAAKTNGHAKGPTAAVTSGSNAGEGYFRTRAANGSAMRAEVPSIDSKVRSEN